MQQKKTEILWSVYMEFRMKQRGYDSAKVEEIIRYSDERYFDTVTHRMVVVGKHDDRLVIIPITGGEDSITPVTIHATTRQQIRFRLRSGRFAYE